MLGQFGSGKAVIMCPAKNSSGCIIQVSSLTIVLLWLRSIPHFVITVQMLLQLYGVHTGISESSSIILRFLSFVLFSVISLLF